MATETMFPALRREIAGVPVEQLARRFGTPVYVYDAAKIEARIHELGRFDLVRYAQKACSNIAILALARKCGAVVDAVSAGEIHRALAAGFKPTDEPGAPHSIVYTADVFDRASLDAVVELGIHVNIGSIDMIDQLGQRSPGREITLRINPGFGHGHSQKTNTGGEQSKHGIWHEQLEKCLQRADYHGMSVTGLHMHIGSGTDFEHLSQVCQAMEACAERVGRTLNTVSAGGGLPTPYRPTDVRVDLDKYFELWDASRKRLEAKFARPLRLEIEPGRYLVAESGYLVAEIRAVKEMGGNTFYLLDAGFNNLARPIMYGAYHPMSIVPVDGAEERSLAPVVVGGPLCESGDIFTQTDGGFVAKRELPVATVGELLVIECAGAYGFAMGSNYNGKPLAAEVLVENGRPHLVRERQSLDDLIRGESIPEFISAK